MTEAAADERFEQAAQLRDAIRTIDTLRQRQQKMTVDGARRSGRVRPQGRPGRRRRPGLPGARRQGRRTRRAGDAGRRRPERRPIRRLARMSCGRRTSFRRRWSSSTPSATAPPEIHLPVALSESETELAAGVADRSRRPSRPARRAQARRKARPARARRAQRAGRLSDALQRDRRRPLRRARNAARRPEPAVDSAPDRLLRHLHDPGQRDRRVDGGLRRRPDEAGGVPEVQDPRSEDPRIEIGGSKTEVRTARPRSSIPGSSTTSPSMHEVVLRRYRKVLENGGPFPDLILIDGGKGQLSAAYAGARDAGAGEPGGGRHRQERRAAVHARSRRSDRARAEQPGAAADPAHSRRSAPLCDHLPPPVARRSAICARRSIRSPASARAAARRC